MKECLVDSALKMSNQFGIRGVANKFFESYLSNRFQYVRINN